MRALKVLFKADYSEVKQNTVPVNWNYIICMHLTFQNVVYAFAPLARVSHLPVLYYLFQVRLGFPAWKARHKEWKIPVPSSPPTRVGCNKSAPEIQLRNDPGDSKSRASSSTGPVEQERKPQQKAARGRAVCVLTQSAREEASVRHFCQVHCNY